MRIVIDLQGVQTSSRFRGIGRYALALAQAIVRHRGGHEVIIVVNGVLPETIQPIRAVFQDLLPPDNICVWQTLAPIQACDPNNDWRREATEQLRAAFLSSLNPDIVWVSSLFEGYVDDAVTGVVLPNGLPVIVTIYDLIPLLNPDFYFKSNPVYERFYQQKISQLRQASRCFAISTASAHEACTALGIAEDWVVSLPGGCDPQFKSLTLSPQEQDQLCQSLGISKPFVLCVGAADFRKNLQRLIQAYARLSKTIREQHQLVIVGRFAQDELAALKNEIKAAEIHDNELVLTGYIDDDTLVKIYNLCQVFVFPSWHEGFGLPLVEAMACGKPVIGANTSSVPEVIGRSDALFDPFEVDSIAQKLTEVLSNTQFRRELAEYGLAQVKKFSWDESARLAIKVFEQVKQSHQPKQLSSEARLRRPTLALVSPLPPEHTGIADYSASLIPALAEYYDIKLVTVQQTVNNCQWQADYPIHTPDWLLENVNQVDRVIYHFGNSFFHTYMLALIEKVPGIVVLHDFFLGGLHSALETNGVIPGIWTAALYHSHGYRAVKERYLEGNVAQASLQYPVNLKILQYATGIIVHSEYSKQLGRQWYGESFSQDWRVIPLLRTPPPGGERENARLALGLRSTDYLVCSFGLMASTKLNHRLLAAWQNSDLMRDPQAILVFVGEENHALYGQQLNNTIRENGLHHRVRMTGRLDETTYRNYLAAADMAVQLRTMSRGETSAAALDCMNYGLPTIINANGSLAELPQNAVWSLPDNFTDAELVDALDTLYRDKKRSEALGAQADAVIRTQHAPARCAKLYAEAIECFHATSIAHPLMLARTLVCQPNSDLVNLAQAIVQNFPFRRASRQILVDVSSICRNDLKTGIERVIRGLLTELLQIVPSGYRIEPVYLSDEQGCWHYKYARQYTLTLLQCPQPDDFQDDVVDVYSGDLLLTLDWSPRLLIDSMVSGLHARWRTIGVKMYSLIYDLLPILLPEAFPLGAADLHAAYLQIIAQWDGAICISQAVAAELKTWLAQHCLTPGRERYAITSLHLGADIENSAPSGGMPSDANAILEQIVQCPTFLMVGTIEPRKGYLQAIEAFSLLWEQGVNVNLIIVGSEGWKTLPDAIRRTIPEITQRLRNHPQRGKRLFWLENVSDEYLKKIYSRSACLIAASMGEGFGLPLIEAARQNLPIIARDIPVFREIAGQQAYYFAGDSAVDLAAAVQAWLILYDAKKHPDSGALSWLTWKQSAENLLNQLIHSPANF